MQVIFTLGRQHSSSMSAECFLIRFSALSGDWWIYLIFYIACLGSKKTICRVWELSPATRYSIRGEEMTLQPLKVHLGADEFRQVIMSSIPGAFNQRGEFTTVQTLPSITPACGYVRWQIERCARCDRGVLRSGREGQTSMLFLICSLNFELSSFGFRRSYSGSHG